MNVVHEIKYLGLTYHEDNDGAINYTDSIAGSLNELARQENKNVNYFVFYPDKFILESKERSSIKLQNVDVQNICNILADYNYVNRNALIRSTARGEIGP
jgi:hypothetical protein